MTDAQERAKDDRYYWPDGSLKWGHPVDVGHLILQLQTLDQAMKVSSISFIDTKEGRKARAYGLSMSRERWDEGGWLNYQLDTPECLAIWANPPDVATSLAQVEADEMKRCIDDVCMYCNGNAPGYNKALGPNSAGNWIHVSKRTTGQDALCRASSILARDLFRQAQRAKELESPLITNKEC